MQRATAGGEICLGHALRTSASPEPAQANHSPRVSFSMLKGFQMRKLRHGARSYPAAGITLLLTLLPGSRSWATHAQPSGAPAGCPHPASTLIPSWSRGVEVRRGRNGGSPARSGGESRTR